MNDIKTNFKFLKTLFFSTILLLMAFSSSVIAGSDDPQILELNYSFEEPSISNVEINNFVYDKCRDIEDDTWDDCLSEGLYECYLNFANLVYKYYGE